MLNLTGQKEAKALMIVVSLIAAIGAMWIFYDQNSGYDDYFSNGDMIILVVLGIATSLLYPVLGAFAIKLCEGVRSWAYKATIQNWSDQQRLLFGAFWPVTVLFSLIVYMYLGIIHRLF